MNKRLRTPIGMPNHPGLYPVDRSAARWLSIMSVRSRPGWPRLGVSNPWFRCESASMMRTYAAGSTLRNSCWPPPPAPHGHDASLVFPDGPTETGHTMGPLPLRARPEKSDVGITCSPPRALLSVLYGPPTACYAGIAHRECVICSFAVLSLHFQVYRCPLFPRFPPISTVSLITGAIRAARVISAYVRTPLSRARSAD